jgi:glycosyltransferase involved in cell wall biosynthesis
MKAIPTTFRINKFQNLDKKINLPHYLNKELSNSKSRYFLLIDDRDTIVKLKNSCIDLMQSVLENNPKAGMVYADYEIVTNGKIEEVYLLKHHLGRVRDNEDYGKIFLFRKSFLEQIDGFNEELKYNYLYEIRLRLSEISEIVHIANKSAGSLYQVSVAKEKTNVFDYLLSGKNVQKEAENVFTNHLKQIGAYLSPKQKYEKRPVTSIKSFKKASIIIPVNNRPEFIIDAIESAQQQTIQDIEIIVIVNGGENDPTNKSVRRYINGGDKYYNDKPEVRLIITDINNIGFCLNLGVNNAQSEYYLQLDSDDRLKPDALEKIIQKFESDPTIGMVIGSYEVWEKLDSGEIIRDDNIPVVTHPEWTEENGRNNLLRINGAGAPRAIPIQLIKDIGFFDMNENPFTRNYGEDYEMVLRICEKYKIGRIYAPIYKVIRHSGGTDHSINQNTINRNNEAKDWMRKKAILRRLAMNK